jgi:hypothetical protein
MSRLIKIGASSQIEELMDRLQEAEIKAGDVVRVDFRQALVVDEGEADSFTLRFCAMKRLTNLRLIRPSQGSAYCNSSPAVIPMDLHFPTPGLHDIYDLLLYVYMSKIVVMADKETVINPQSTWPDLETLRSLADESTKPTLAEFAAV